MTVRTRAFTLVELLSAMAILAILIALLVPSFRSINEKGKTTRCLSNLRTLGTGVAAYLGDNDNTLPLFSSSSSNWVWDISPYLPIPVQPFSVSKRSILFCPKAYSLASKPISSGATTYYGINERVSGFRMLQIRVPSKTALFTDSSTPAAISVRIDRPPSLIHGTPQAAMVLYADFHVDGITSIEPWSAPFWKPDAE